MSKKNNIGICILFFEKTDQTINCINSFLQTGCSIYVLNNGSSFSSQKKLKNFCSPYRNIKIFDSKKNLGVGNGRNYLIRQTKEPWLLFVDNDIINNNISAIEELSRYIEKNPAVEVFIPNLFNRHEGTYSNYQSFNIVNNHAVYTDNSNEKFINTFPGGASLISRKLFKRLGLYDKKIFVGLEDFELSIRAIIKKNPIKAMKVNTVEFIHYHKPLNTKEDKNAIEVRYNRDLINESFKRIVEKHGIVLEQGEWEKWLLIQKKHFFSNSSQNQLQFFIEKIQFLIETFKKKIPIELKISIKQESKSILLLFFAFLYKLQPLAYIKKKKIEHILFFTHLDHIGGVEKVILSITIYLLRNKYKISMFFTSRVQEPLILKEFKKKKIYCQRLGSSDGFFQSIRQANRIYDYIIHNSVDIVIITNIPAFLHVWKVLKKSASHIKLICWIHGTYEKFINVNAAITYNKLFSKIIVLNNYLYSFFKKKNINSAIILHNGINEKHFEPSILKKEYWKEKLNIPPNFFVCTYIGRYAFDKNPKFIIDIARKMKKKSVMFMMIGEGDQEPFLKKYIQKGKLEKIIRMYSYHSDIRPFLAASDVLLLTSAAEGMPISVLEAMSMGIPPITSRYLGVKDLFTSGIQGFAVPLKVKEYQNAIDTLKSNKKLYNSMSSSARQHIIDNFTESKFHEKFLSVLKS